MSDAPAFLAIDHGTATVAVSVIARVDGRWRLLGSTAAPAAISPDALARRVVARLEDVDAGLAGSLGPASPGAVERLPRLASRTTRPPLAAVVAPSTRGVARLAAVAGTAGWRTRPLALETGDPLVLASGIADPEVEALILGTSDPPGADERSHRGDLAALVGGVLARRPDLALVLAGGMADQASAIEVQAGPREGATLVAPAADGGSPPGDGLRTVLDELRADPHDGRRALARAAGTLAATLDRRLEVVELGSEAASRVRATPLPDGTTDVRWAVVPAAALVPSDVPDAVVDGVAGWSTLHLDRLRLRDRLRELRVAPWAESHGDGAPLRLAAARAALARLVEATPHLSDTAPDLVIAAGGVWSVAPGSAVGLALADVLRRPGATGLAHDHARLLAPLGTIEDEEERRAIVADLARDLLAPLGSVVMPAGLRAGRAGQLVVHAEGGVSEVELVPGGLELVDLPPGERAIVELRFRDSVALGTRARHFALDVGGGLGGLLVDLRDVPLRLPERLDRRRELLSAWQAALWAGLEDGR